MIVTTMAKVLIALTSVVHEACALQLFLFSKGLQCFIRWLPLAKNTSFCVEITSKAKVHMYP